MLLSQKLHELRELINEELCFSGPMRDGFNDCIKDAELLEGSLADYIKLLQKTPEFCEMCKEEKELKSDNLCKECYEKLPC